MNLIKVTATGRKKKEYYFKPEDFVFIKIENGETHIILSFNRIGTKDIVVKETPEEINELYAEAMKN